MKRALLAPVLATLLVAGCAQRYGTKSVLPQDGCRPVHRCRTCSASMSGIRDRDLAADLRRRLQGLYEAGETVPTRTLIGQLERKSFSAALPKPGRSPVRPTAVYSNLGSGVVAVVGLCQCRDCGGWRVGVSSGFVLTESGLVATCRHVVDVPHRRAIAVRTADGGVHPVREVVAADAAEDVAVVRIDAKGLTPLPVVADEPVGSSVTVISHPDERFYTMTSGIVSRYFARQRGGRSVTRMAITADFARGSSGAPVFNESGNVVGMVACTDSIHNGDGPEGVLQMVVRCCVPGRALLGLVDAARTPK